MGAPGGRVPREKGLDGQDRRVLRRDPYPGVGCMAQFDRFPCSRNPSAPYIAKRLALRKSVPQPACWEGDCLARSATLLGAGPFACSLATRLRATVPAPVGSGRRWRQRWRRGRSHSKAVPCWDGSVRRLSARCFSRHRQPPPPLFHVALRRRGRGCGGARALPLVSPRRSTAECRPECDSTRRPARVGQVRGGWPRRSGQGRSAAGVSRSHRGRAASTSRAERYGGSVRLCLCGWAAPWRVGREVQERYKQVPPSSGTEWHTDRDNLRGGGTIWLSEGSHSHAIMHIMLSTSAARREGGRGSVNCVRRRAQLLMFGSRGRGCGDDGEPMGPRHHPHREADPRRG